MSSDPQHSVSQQAQGSYLAQATNGGVATVQVFSVPASRKEQNRVRFLDQLQHNYTKQLEQSLWGTTLLQLGLTEKATAVLQQSELSWFEASSSRERALALGTSIMQVYNEAAHQLLILGEPGAGKSTLLLTLARQLVELAQQDEQQGLPLIVPLSSWAVKRLPLQEWLAEQICQLYCAPHKVVQDWLQRGLILPLLDGLDEVPEAARVDCVKAITAYRHENIVHMVVCCRSSEYEQIAREQRLRMESAVVLQPLSNEQVEEYLQHAGEKLAALRILLRGNPVLRELMTTPLMLRILSLTYADAAVGELTPHDSVVEQQRTIFTLYVQHMVRSKRSSLVRINASLSWLARLMQKRDQSVFYLEHLQLDSFSVAFPQTYPVAERIRRFRNACWLLFILPGILLGSLVSLTISLFFNPLDRLSLLDAVIGGFLGMLISFPPVLDVLRLETPSTSEESLGTQRGRRRRLPWWLSVASLIGVLSVALATGWLLYAPAHFDNVLAYRFSAAGLSASGWLCLSFILPRISASQSTLSEGKHRRLLWWRSIAALRSIHGQRMLWVIVIAGLSFGLIYGITAGLPDGSNIGLYQGLLHGLRSGLQYGLVCLSLSLVFDKSGLGIQLTDYIHWSWYSLRNILFSWKHLLASLLFAISIGMGFGLNTGLSNGIGYGLIYGLSNGLSYGLIFGLITGLSSTLSYGLSLGLSYWLILGLFQSVDSEKIEDEQRLVPNQGIHRSLLNSFFIGLFSGVLVGIISIFNAMLLAVLNLLSNDGLYLGLNTGINHGLTYAQNTAWLLGICTAFLVCAISGCLAVLRHYGLRFLLSRRGVLPWHSVQFLDEATRCILLRRVGGGYSFTHRLLLEYFASLSDNTKE